MLKKTVKYFLRRLALYLIVKVDLPILFGLTKKAKEKGLEVRFAMDHVDIIRGSDVLRIFSGHMVYFGDIINFFDYYFGAVIPVKVRGKNIVDYSSPRYHEVVGFDAYPILFPSFSEPLSTTTQYMEFAALSEGMVVLDLGAYSGLTSIVFSQAVGLSGIVVAVEADIENIDCIKRNLYNYSKCSPNKILILEGAVWENDDGIEFSCEGNMGAGAVSIVGDWRGTVRKIPSFTLSSIANQFGLQRIDFIKCDIEGAENIIFTDREFFQRFLPKIIIEAHLVDGVETTDKCIADLEMYGYTFRKVVQKGVFLPLLECYPPSHPSAN